MTRKDYIQLAAALHAARVPNPRDEENRALYNNGIDNAIVYIADALAIDNPRFDRDRFYTACKGD